MAHFNRRRRWCWLTTTAIVVCSASFLQVAGEDTKNAGTIKSVSRLVVVDTIVTDSSGQPLRGLKAEDFTVVEDGKPQKLALFSEEEPNTTTLAAHPPLPPNVFTNRPEYSNPTGALTVILLDGLNTPTQDQAYAREQLLKYLASQQDSTQRIAILALGNSLSLLQDFTSDPRPHVDRRLAGHRSKSCRARARAGRGRGAAVGRARRGIHAYIRPIDHLRQRPHAARIRAFSLAR